MEPTVFGTLQVDPAALGAALVLVLLAGLSEAAGQSVVLTQCLQEAIGKVSRCDLQVGIG